MTRWGGWLFVSGATVGLIGLALPQDPRPDVVVLLGMALLAYLIGALLLIVRARAPRWLLHVVLAAGTIDITICVASSGEVISAYTFLYTWVMFYAAWFFSRRAMLAHWALVAAGYGIALALGDGGTILPVWTITMATLLGTALLLERVRDRMLETMRALRSVARTDPLTGLPNRRGFEEVFEREIERARRVGAPLGVVIGDLDHFKDVNDSGGHRAGDAALERVAVVLDDAKRRMDVAARVGGEEFALLVPESDGNGAALLAERLRCEIASIFRDGEEPLRMTISFGVAAFPVHGEDAEALFHAADQALYAAKELGRNRVVVHSPDVVKLFRGGARARRIGAPTSAGHTLEAVLAIAEALDLRDGSATGHSTSVGAYAELMARELGLPPAEVERIRLAGVLHDIGKIGVSDVVLFKPGPLTKDEWSEISRHPEIGARLLGDPGLEDLRSWVLAHHERPDGDGYPRRLAGDEIPLGARIVAVADAYEAMTNARVYRYALDPAVVRSELLKNSGTQFDREVVRALLAALDRHDPHSPSGPSLDTDG